MNSPSTQCVIGKIALVTGAASGIGKATALRFAAECTRVALTALYQPEVARVADAICAVGGQAIALRLDVTSESDGQSAMTRILTEWGRLDVCVNGAGIAFARLLTDTTLADWRRVMATNLDSVFLGRRPLTLEFYRKHGYGEIGRSSYGSVETVQFRKTLIPFIEEPQHEL